MQRLAIGSGLAGIVPVFDQETTKKTQFFNKNQDFSEMILSVLILPKNYGQPNDAVKTK
jgi:hypothetical protein